MCDKIKYPSECSQKELEDFYQLVLKGGQVEKYGLKNRIKGAELLAFHHEENTLVGIAALKRPNAACRQRVFRRAGLSEKSDRYNLEIGWAFTMCEYRGKGICSSLIQKIIDTFGSQNIFATTRTDNLSMQRILEKNGFQKIGKPCQGMTNKDVQLFTRCVRP